jgi:hypothetical protein
METLTDRRLIVLNIESKEPTGQEGSFVQERNAVRGPGFIC